MDQLIVILKFPKKQNQNLTKIAKLNNEKTLYLFVRQDILRLYM